MDFQKRMIAVFIGSVAFVSTSFGQQSLKPAVERLFNKIESDIVTAAEAMPEDKFNFTPESLDIANSNFKGVRTFGGQILHLATDNIFMWSAITGDSVRADIEDVNGPKTLTTKKEIIDYLKSSFAIGRKAIATLTDQNAMDEMEYLWRKLPRLDLVFYALTHSNEHYGQMVVYLRLCGITPPATINQQ
ncbi:MAG TPA: DinB family protein [Panacibacter sp.]|nr:DinB family protein [Panacibacter sp.]HNP47059.1 DinB family protein [Panacibacter sp.]